MITLNHSIIAGGTYNMQVAQPQQAVSYFDFLADKSAPEALHNSANRTDCSKCHPNTRLAVLKKVMDWITSQESETKKKLLMWLKGPAGSGKSTIAQTIAERCDEEGRLLASFFFGRSDPSRNNSKPLIATIAYQICCYIPTIKDTIVNIIEKDPLIFAKNLLVQVESLVINPLCALKSAGYFINPECRRVIVIDGLDECISRSEQLDILDAIFHCIKKLGSSISFLLASRSEQEISASLTSENSWETLTTISLDQYSADDDIRLFLQNQLENIKKSYPLRRLLPAVWPREGVVEYIVQKSSGQFIYASTVIKYIKSLRHRPDHRLDIVQNLRPRASEADMPFAQLDALYTHVLSSVEDIDILLHVFAIYIYQREQGYWVSTEFIEKLCFFEHGTIEVLLSDLTALVTLKVAEDDDSEMKQGQSYITFLHASLTDFFMDNSRSKRFYIGSEWAITKQIGDCFSFIARNDYLMDEAVRFFLENHKSIRCTEELASLLAPPAVFRMYQNLTQTSTKGIPDALTRNFLPEVADFFKISGLQREYMLYLKCLDDVYLDMIKPYYTSMAGSLKLAIAANLHIIPNKALSAVRELTPFHLDRLELVYKHGYMYAERWTTSLAEFLHDSSRSKRYSLHSMGPTIYRNAALACFQYLVNVAGHTMDIGLSLGTSEVKIPHQDHPEHDSNICKHDVPDSTCACLQLWRGGWNDVYRNESYEHEKYYLLLGYMVLFLPLAGTSKTLMNFCEGTLEVCTTFKEDKETKNRVHDCAQHAMNTYVKKMKNL